MKKEAMLENISAHIDIIETALEEIENRIDYPALNDKIAALGNYSEQELPFIAKLTQFVVNNSDDFRSKRGIDGGVLRNSYLESKKKPSKKNKTTSPLKAEVLTSLESKMVSATYPLDENPDGSEKTAFSEEE